MKVLRVPSRLRIATALLALCVPLAAFETILVARAPWWRLPYRTIEVWSLAVGLLCLPLAGWMSHGKRWALSLTAILGLVWCLLTAWVGYRFRNPSLGFFTVVLMIFWGALCLWLRHEMGRSFFDPRLRWYQGLPRPIPGLKCQLNAAEFRVSRLDSDGAFIFSDQAGALRLAGPQEAEMLFSFRDRQIRCRGVPVRSLEQEAGAGFQFRGMPADSRKELGDFVETLRGEGHAQ